MHHVSTAYVNANLVTNTVVPEEVLPWVGGEYWEEWVDKLTKMDHQKLDEEEPEILKTFGFLNTYTLTKNLAE